MSAMEADDFDDVVSLAGMDLDEDDMCQSILGRFRRSHSEEHRHLCAAAEAMSQLIKSQNLPSKPTAYFAAIMNSLSQTTASADDKLVSTALCTFLALALPRVPEALLRSKWEPSLQTLVEAASKTEDAAGGLKAVMKCMSFMLCLGPKTDWNVIAPAFMALLDHVVDRRPKVRKRAQLCMGEVLVTFKNTPAMLKACEEVQNLFEHFILKAGGSNVANKTSPSATTPNNSNGAMEVLHMLNAFKCILPYLTKKAISKLLPHFKLLLELRQSFLTRNVMNALYALCISNSTEIPAAMLMELLSWLCSFVFGDDKPADDMKFATMVLLHGVKKVYDLDMSSCTTKLPAIFHALAEILTIQHEAVIMGASQTLQYIISNCIDEGIISEGVAQVTLLGGNRQLAPTSIERICATAESLLGYQYSTSWDVALKVVSVLFDRLGRSSNFLMKGVLNNLADLQKLSDDDLPSRKQLHKCIGSAIAAMGAHNFLEHLPLNLDTEELTESNVWLIPILKQHIIGSRLSCFKKQILDLAERLKARSKSLEEAGRPIASRNMLACVSSLWSLLPSFCNYPEDTAEQFKLLSKTLCQKVLNEPDLRGIICSSLQILIQQNKEAKEKANGNLLDTRDVDGLEESLSERRAKSLYDVGVVSANLKVLSKESGAFLNTLFTVFESSPEDKRGFLQATIADFASISERIVVQNFFKTAMRKLLEATKKAINGDQNQAVSRAQLLELGASLLGGLDVEAINTLFAATKPALKEDNRTIQKKAYKVLARILKEHPYFLQNNYDGIFELMVTSMPDCHFSSKKNRLICVHYLIIHMLKNGMELNEGIVSFLSEILLAIKETNKKSRTCAYDLLVSIGRCMGDYSNGGSKEKLQKFFELLVGCIAGSTPQMMSAAVTGLARLVYEFSELCQLVPNLLPSIFTLLNSNNREIIKACLGFIKVTVARFSPEDLQHHLKFMVDSLLLITGPKRNSFKAKVRLLLEMLIRKCSLESVTAVMPEQHLKLLANIRKVNNRKEKKKTASSQLGADELKSFYSQATSARKSKWNHTDIFSDLEDQDSDYDSDGNMGSGKSAKSGLASSAQRSKVTSRSRNIRKSKKRLHEDLIDESKSEPLDLLDKQRTRAMLNVRKAKGDASDSDDEPNIAPDGRMVFTEEDADSAWKKQKAKKKELEDDNDNQSQRSRKSKAHSTSTSKSNTQRKRQKTSDAGWAYTGKEYVNKKAKGDVKRDGKLEPYAYWPLDTKMLNRREEKRATARKGLSSVMKLTKNLQGKSVKKALEVKPTNSKKRKFHKRK